MVTRKINSTVLVLYLMVKYHDQRNLGSNGFIMTGPNHSPSGRKTRTETQGRNQEAGPGAEANEEHCLLACCLWLTYATGYFLYSKGPLVQGVTTQIGLYLPKSIINHKIILETYLQTHLIESFSLPVFFITRRL